MVGPRIVLIVIFGLPEAVARTLEIRFTFNKHYLLGCFFSRNAKETHTDQSTLQVFLLYLERNDSQTFKSSSCGKLFLQCVCYRYNLLQWMFFIPRDNWKALFFIKVCWYLKIFSTATLLLPLKQTFWEKSVFYVISTMTVQC